MISKLVVEHSSHFKIVPFDFDSLLKIDIHCIYCCFLAFKHPFPQNIMTNLIKTTVYVLSETKVLKGVRGSRKNGVNILCP